MNIKIVVMYITNSLIMIFLAFWVPIMSGSFTRDLRTYVFGLPRRKLSEVLRVLNDYLLRETLPGRILSEI